MKIGIASVKVSVAYTFTIQLQEYHIWGKDLHYDFNRWENVWVATYKS